MCISVHRVIKLVISIIPHSLRHTVSMQWLSQNMRLLLIFNWQCSLHHSNSAYTANSSKIFILFDSISNVDWKQILKSIENHQKSRFFSCTFFFESTESSVQVALIIAPHVNENIQLNRITGTSEMRMYFHRGCKSSVQLVFWLSDTHNACVCVCACGWCVMYKMYKKFFFSLTQNTIKFQQNKKSKIWTRVFKLNGLNCVCA